MQNFRTLGLGLAVALSMILLSTDSATAQNGSGHQNGKRGGFSALKDADGDGTPNCIDPDYVPQNPAGSGSGFVDADGNGVNDRQQDDDGDGVINCQDPDSPLFRQGNSFRSALRGMRNRIQAVGTALRNRYGNRDCTPTQ